MSRNIGIKDQAPGLQLAESFILCGHQANKIQIKSIAVLLHSDDSVKLAHGKVTDKGRDVDMTRLESRVAFLPVKASDNEGETVLFHQVLKLFSGQYIKKIRSISLNKELFRNFLRPFSATFAKI